MTSGSRSMANNSARAGASGRASMLFPIAQRGDGQVECLGELHLRHPEALPQDFYARHSAHLRKLLGSERLGIGVGQRSSHHFFIGHGFDPRPIGVAPRQGFTRFHGYPRIPVLLCI